MLKGCDYIIIIFTHINIYILAIYNEQKKFIVKSHDYFKPTIVNVNI